MAGFTKQRADKNQIEANFIEGIARKHFIALLKELKAQYPGEFLAPALFVVIGVAVDSIVKEIQAETGNMTADKYRLIQDLINQQIETVKKNN